MLNTNIIFLTSPLHHHWRQKLYLHIWVDRTKQTNREFLNCIYVIKKGFLSRLISYWSMIFIFPHITSWGGDHCPKRDYMTTPWWLYRLRVLLLLLSIVLPLHQTPQHSLSEMASKVSIYHSCIKQIGDAEFSQDFERS